MATLDELDIELAQLEQALQDVQQERVQVAEVRKQLADLIYNQTGERFSTEPVQTSVPVTMGFVSKITSNTWLLLGGAGIAAYLVLRGRG